MVVAMVGINAINITAGVKNVAVTPPAPKNGGGDAASTDNLAVSAPVSSQVEPSLSGQTSGVREVLLEDNIVLRISYDDDSGRFIYSGVDKTTGDVVRQYPPEGVLKLLAQHRADAAGLLIDEES
jgi:uncharacterized FlaG/YvyC family protein